MGKHKSIELIARGVCVKQGRILLCHSKGAKNTFLPGGHVEWHEAAAVALCREIDEELGITAVVGRFLGAVEHTFRQGRHRKPHHEINLVFDFDLPGRDSSSAPESRESAIEFFWVPLGELADSRLEPAPLRKLVPDWLAGPAEGSAGWGTTIAP